MTRSPIRCPVGCSCSVARAAAGSAIAAVASSSPASAGHNTNIAYDSQTVMHVDVHEHSRRQHPHLLQRAVARPPSSPSTTTRSGISRPDGILGRTSYITSNCRRRGGRLPVGGSRYRRPRHRQLADRHRCLCVRRQRRPQHARPPTAPASTRAGPANGVVAIARDAGGVALTANAPTDGRAAVLNGRTEVTGPLAAQDVSATSLSAPTVSATTAVGDLGVGDHGHGGGRASAEPDGRSGHGDGQASVDPGLRRAGDRELRGGRDPPEGQEGPLRRRRHARSPAIKVKISFNKKAPSGTVVGWVVVN